MSYVDENGNIFYNPSQPDNEIWYESSDNKIIELTNDAKVYGDTDLTDILSLQSNTYNGIGKLNFSKPIIALRDLFSSSNLIKIYLPSSISIIDDYTFNQCINLSVISIPESVITIGNFAFSTCEKLNEISLPDSLATIGQNAFYSCKSLIKASIGSNCSLINNFAFQMCNKSLNIVINAITPPTLKPGAFDNSVVIQVPSESIELYKSANIWSIYANNIQAISE